MKQVLAMYTQNAPLHIFITKELFNFEISNMRLGLRIACSLIYMHSLTTLSEFEVSPEHDADLKNCYHLPVHRSLEALLKLTEFNLHRRGNTQDKTNIRRSIWTLHSEPHMPVAPASLVSPAVLLIYLFC